MPLQFVRNQRATAPRWKPSYNGGWVFGILLYELLLGATAWCLHPLVALFLAVGPFVFLIGLSRPVWAYGLFIVSIQFSNISLAQLGPFQLRIVDMGFFLLLGLFIAKGLTERSLVIPRTGIDAPLWFFLSWIMVSYAWSLDFAVGFEALIKIFIGVATFYITVSLIRDRSRLSIAIGIWMLAGLVSAFAAVFEFTTVAVHHIEPGMTRWANPVRSQGFFGGPIMLGSFLTLTVCINYGLIIKARSFWERIFLLSTCGVMIIALFTTLSRNDIAAWFLITAFFNYRFKGMRLPTAMMLMIILLFGLLLTGGKLFTVFWDRFFYVFEGLETSSQMRVDIWRLALKTITEHPLVGVGLGGFPAIAQAAERYGSLVYPHSLILYVLVEFGFVGFTLVSYLGVMIFRFVRAAEKGISAPSDKAIGSAMTAGLLVHLFWCLSQNITFQHIIFWAYLGISFATYHVLSTNIGNGAEDEKGR